MASMIAVPLFSSRTATFQFLLNERACLALCWTITAQDFRMPVCSSLTPTGHCRAFAHRD
jgi:hypothetical protein